MPWHLLFPLFSSLVFVLGMLWGKRAISAGVRPWTSTFLSNAWLAVAWSAVGLGQPDWLPMEAWGQATLVGLAFVCGQMFSFLAFQHGDVSVATPIFGVKVIMVALLLALLGDEPVEGRIWAGAILATVGVGVMQVGGRSTSHGQLTWFRAVATIVLALLSALSLSLFDVGLQLWGRRWGANQFLPVAFAAGGLLSCGFLPWCDRPQRIRDLGVSFPLGVGTFLIALQAVSMSFSLGHFGDATRINIVYALRGLWAVGLAWLLARSMGTAEAHVPPRIMGLRLLGAVLLTAAVLVALFPGD
ncbi:MAG: EamA family transporter [Pirellulales bacterium]